MSNSYTKTYADGATLTESKLDSAYQSLEPSQANLALATTGSNAADILTSAGSNTTPAWASPNTVAQTITATGANAILGVVTSCQASVANLIGLQMTATAAQSIASNFSAVGANIVIGAASSQAVPTALFANTIIDAATSCSSTVANIFADAVIRTTATLVSHLGVAISPSCGAVTVSSTSFVNVSSLTVSITTNGRPVFIGTISDTTGSASTFSANPGATLTIQLLRGTSTLATHAMSGDSATGVTENNFGNFFHIDPVAAGTYVYALQAKASGGNGFIDYLKLAAYEL